MNILTSESTVRIKVADFRMTRVNRGALEVKTKTAKDGGAETDAGGRNR